MTAPDSATPKNSEGQYALMIAAFGHGPGGKRCCACRFAHKYKALDDLFIHCQQARQSTTVLWSGLKESCGKFEARVG